MILSSVGRYATRRPAADLRPMERRMRQLRILVVNEPLPLYATRSRGAVSARDLVGVAFPPRMGRCAVAVRCRLLPGGIHLVSTTRKTIWRRRRSRDQRRR
jgi:hypothetical protein